MSGAKFMKVNRAWAKNADDSTMRCYMGIEGRVTLAELAAHFWQNYPLVDVSELQLNFATVVWEEPPTADDIRKRQDWRAEKARRLEQWERETYERLRKKYEGGAR